MHTIKIGHHQVGLQHPPFIVAELSANHQGSLEHALKLLEVAKISGAHAVKLQTYTADTMTLDLKREPFVINNQQSLWNGMSLYDLYQQAHTPWEWHEPLFKRCKELDLVCFSTPFDITAVDFLEKFDVPCYKIASLELLDLALIQKAASTGKPLLISTGAATLCEIEEAVEAAREAGSRDIILLKCTAAYPAPVEEANLRTLPHLMASFGTLVGFSDHSLGIGAAIASVALGACVIEKHLAYSRDVAGLDIPFSLIPAELEALVRESRLAWNALGEIHYGQTISENACMSLRRSLYFIRDMKQGERVTAEAVKAIRPGHGLPPKELSHILGMILQKDVKKGDPVSWKVFQN